MKMSNIIRFSELPVGKILSSWQQTVGQKTGLRELTACIIRYKVHISRLEGLQMLIYSANEILSKPNEMLKRGNPALVL